MVGTEKINVKIRSVIPVKAEDGVSQRTYTGKGGALFNIMNVILDEPESRTGSWLWDQKPENELKPGMTVELEITGEQKGSAIRYTIKYPVKARGSWGGGGRTLEERQEMIRSGAIQSAALMISHNPHIIEKVKGKESASLFQFANEIANWIQTGSRKPAPAATTPAPSSSPSQQTSTTSTPIKVEAADLPF